MKRLLLFAALLLVIAGRGAAQDLTLGTNTLRMRLIESYDSRQDTVLLFTHGEPAAADVFHWELSPLDTKNLMQLRLTIPYDAQYLGEMEVRIVAKSDTSRQIASPVIRQVRAPKPDIVSVQRQEDWLQEANILRWDHTAGEIPAEITGHHFFPGEEPNISFADPYLQATEITADTSAILFSLQVSEGANPGMKEMRIENYGGASDTVEFNLYSTARPQLKPLPPRERTVIYTGVAKRISIPMTAPQNVAELYLASDSRGQNRVENALISIEPGAADQQEELPVRMVILDRHQASYDLYVVTKNVDAQPYRFARLSDIVSVKDKDIKFEPVRKYVGDYLNELTISSESAPNVNDLEANTGYTLRSPNNEVYRVTYERQKHALVFDNPVKLDVSDQGNWRLEEKAEKYVAYVGVRKIPTIVSLSWEQKDQNLREMFDGQPYATRTQQVYTLTIDIRDLSGSNFPVDAIDFFGSKGEIISTPTKKPTKGDFERFVCDIRISGDVEPNFEYPIIYKPINRLIGRVRFRPFNRPVGKHETSGFLVFHSLDNSAYPLNQSGTYQTQVEYRPERNSVSLVLKPPDNGYGKQYLDVEATLYDDAGQQKGKVFTGTIRSDKPRLDIQFPRQKRAGYEKIYPWDAVYIKATHAFSKYSPQPSEDEVDIRNTEYTWEQEFIFAGASRYKRRVDIVTPVQQSVYVMEGDSVRASLFNVGVNLLWYRRKASDYRQFDFLSYGVSLFTSELDRLANSQYASLGMAGLLNFDIASKMELAVGFGGILEYRFKDRKGAKAGMSIRPAMVIQMRLPFGRMGP